MAHAGKRARRAPAWLDSIISLIDEDVCCVAACVALHAEIQTLTGRWNSAHGIKWAEWCSLMCFYVQDAKMKCSGAVLFWQTDPNYRMLLWHRRSIIVAILFHHSRFVCHNCFCHTHTCTCTLTYINNNGPLQMTCMCLYESIDQSDIFWAYIALPGVGGRVCCQSCLLATCNNLSSLSASVASLTALFYWVKAGCHFSCWKNNSNTTHNNTGKVG